MSESEEAHDVDLPLSDFGILLVLDLDGRLAFLLVTSDVASIALFPL